MPEQILDDPQISVDRASKQIGILNGFRLVRDFKPYTDEATAVAEAKAWVKERSSVEPMMCYPKIKKITMWG